MVTIAPFILLGLLGVTFYLGSRPETPRVHTLDDLSTRSRTGGIRGLRVSSTTAEATSAPTTSGKADARSSNMRIQGQAPVSDPYESPAQRSELTSHVQTTWVLHTSGAATGSTQSSAPMGRAKPAVATSQRSLPSVWKAGQGDKTYPEQVNVGRSMDCGRGEHGISSLGRASISVF